MAKNSFSTERKHSCFSIIPARTRSVVYTYEVTQAQKAKNRGEPRKMTHSSETEIFWGGPNGKVVAPGILVISPVYISQDTYLLYNILSSPVPSKLKKQSSMFALKYISKETHPEGAKSFLFSCLTSEGQNPS